MLMQTFRIMHRTPLVLAIALLTSVSAFAQQTEINDVAFFGFTNGAKDQNIAFTSAVVKGYKQAANPGPLGFAAWLVQELFVAKVF